MPVLRLGMASGRLDAGWDYGRPQIAWAEGVAEKTDNGRRVALMISLLCPDQQHVLDDALGPRPTMRNFQSGKALRRLWRDRPWTSAGFTQGRTELAMCPTATRSV